MRISVWLYILVNKSMASPRRGWRCRHVVHGSATSRKKIEVFSRVSTPVFMEYLSIWTSKPWSWFFLEGKWWRFIENFRSMPSYLVLFEVFDDFWLALAQNFTDCGDPAIGVLEKPTHFRVGPGRVQKSMVLKSCNENPQGSQNLWKDYHSQHFHHNHKHPCALTVGSSIYLEAVCTEAGSLGLKSLFVFWYDYRNQTSEDRTDRTW